MVTVLKTVVRQRTGGSNPSLSAFCSKASVGFTFQRFLLRVCWSLNAMPLRPFPCMEVIKTQDDWHAHVVCSYFD